MSSLENATSLLTKLKGLADAGDVEGGKATLSQLKIAMLDFPSSPEHTKVATEALELGVLLTVSEGDLDAFARSMAQLKPYYAGGGGTAQKSHILGLNLMYLLVDNRLSEFHSELELLTDQEASNTFVSFPINLERQLMVGIYDEVLNAGMNVPDPSYQFFVDNLLQTVRDSIADCVEVSYKTMKIKDAMTMMKFDTQKALMEYVQECRDDWIVEGETLCFQPPPMGSKASDIPSMKLISQSLSYATEMERIV
ncbi:ATPase regulatory subunit 8 [Seminavis robusta]|uniref:ATPase regulatory subunit 8 n=1 Tax=Seminavis robusta TaxID=568900 RepID=A0A9N8DG61_9STRA|nr:ATPase regulatory subunit 8 [Seminavis robusta]|eukprot:Sro103_g052440.1 ATPase regulatory subunit 8 (253) ;mRNA; f:40987-41745